MSTPAPVDSPLDTTRLGSSWLRRSLPRTFFHGFAREYRRGGPCTHACTCINSARSGGRAYGGALNGETLLYGPVWENNGRTVSQSCFMGCNCGLARGLADVKLGPALARVALRRKRGRARRDRSVTVLTFATNHETSFCERRRASPSTTGVAELPG